MKNDKLANAYSPYRILFHKDRLEKFYNDEFFVPVSIGVNLTNVCNFNCVWCAEREYRKKFSTSSLAYDTVLKLVEDLGKLGVKAITWDGGGEPTQHPEFFNIFSSLNSKLQHGLITNGSALYKFPKKVADTFSYIRVSLDSGTSKTHSKLHGVKREVFSKILFGISKLKNEGYKGIIGVSYIVSPDNVEEIVTAASVVKNAGADYIQFKPLRGEDSKVCIVDANKFLEETYSLNSDSFSVFATRLNDSVGFDKNRGYKFCYAHRFVGAISANGAVELCCHSKHFKKSLEFGNINNDSFYNIWKSKKRNDVIKIVEKNPKFVESVCPYCRMDVINKMLDIYKNGVPSSLAGFL